MPPPKLATDAPIADILHPVQVDLLELVRDNGDLPALDGFDGWLGERLRLDEPLLAGPGLHHRVAAHAMTDGVRMRFHLDQQAILLQADQQVFAAIEPVEALVRPGVLVEGSVLVEDVDQRQAVPLGDLEVDRVMSRCDL